MIDTGHSWNINLFGVKAILKYVCLLFLHKCFVFTDFLTSATRLEMGRSERFTYFVLRAPSPVVVWALRSHICCFRADILAMRSEDGPN